MSAYCNLCQTPRSAHKNGKCPPALRDMPTGDPGVGPYPPARPPQRQSLASMLTKLVEWEEAPLERRFGLHKIELNHEERTLQDLLTRFVDSRIAEIMNRHVDEEHR